MITVYIVGEGCSRPHKEADGFYFQDGLLHILKGKEIVASYPQVNVLGVEKKCCCQD